MLLSGVWLLCPDGVVRPIIEGEIAAADGSWVKAPFLIDTGADATVFSANSWLTLGRSPVQVRQHISGVGGDAGSVALDTTIRFTRDGGVKVTFRGQFAAVTEPDALDMSVLGRDITNLFAVLVDRPSDVICLLGQQHGYRIEQT